MVALKNFIVALFISLNAFFVKTPAIATPTPLPQVSIFPSATMAPTESPLNPEVDLKLIKSAFAAKYGRKTTDVLLTTTNYNGTHFVGNVSFRLAMAGGIILAAKDASRNWTVVMDGNGQIPCELIKPYNFPIDMVPECYNRLGKLVKIK